MISKFCVVQEIALDIFVCYHALHPDPLFFSKNTFDRIFDGDTSPGITELLIKRKLIVSTEEDDSIHQRYVNFNRSMNAKIDTMYLILTTACNFACSYCAVEPHNSKNGINMCDAVIEKSLALFSQSLKRNNITQGQVILYGGEPLIAFESIRYVINCTKRNNYPFSFSLITNGTLVTEEMASFLSKEGVMVSISLDGPPEINDSNRTFKTNNAGTYEKAKSGLDILLLAGNRVGLALTINQHTVNNEASIREWIKTMPFSGVYCNLLHSFHLSLIEKIKLYEMSADFCFDLLMVDNIYEGRSFRQVSSLERGDFILSDCAAVGANQITIEPNGNIFVCHCARDSQPLGNVRDIDIDSLDTLFSTSVEKKWCSYAPIERTECLTCPSVSICGGGCPGFQFSEPDGSFAKDIPYCKYSNRLMKRYLLLSFTKKGITIPEADYL